MKKLLLNQKSLKLAFFGMLFCANVGWSQTVFEETFGSTAVTAANSYSGGTSNPSVNYTTNIAGYSAVGLDTNNNGFLNFVSNGTANRVSLTGALPSGSGLNGVLHSNTNLVSWTFNMKAGRLSTNTFSASTAYPVSKYFNATILCATNSSLLSNSASPGTGYAVVVQKSSAPSTTRAVINLIKFTNGIGDGVAPESSIVQRLIESPELIQTPALTTPNNLSIKVTYNPSIDLWELSYREDPGTIFVDPTSGSLTIGGTATDVPTTTPMTNFGYAVGLQTSTSAQNSYQFDNFKIALSPLPAYTAPPVVEKRQAFNSNSNPTIADLVAAGTDLKWYASVTGGSAIPTNTPLTYANYYVSQTMNSTESTRVATQVFVGDTGLKTLPLHESFGSYNIADKLILMNNGASTAVATNAGVGLGSWSIIPSSNITDDVTIATSPSWAPSILPTATGNALTFVGSGIDPQLKFTNTTTGSLFSSFVFTAADAASIVASTTSDPNFSTPTGLYSFISETTDAVTGLVSTGYASDVMFRRNMVTGKFNIGLSKSNSGTECVWSPTEYDFNTEHVIVISYENIGDANALNQVSNLWIDPSSTNQPVATLTQNNPTTSVTRDHLDGIKLLQASSSSTPLVIIDEIRVANNWGEAIGTASTYVALPVVESRQAFNSSLNPTVADLVAVGIDLKWYYTSTGGSALLTSTPLTYNNYYVSQTVNGNESPRVGTQVFVGDIALKTLPLYEGFGAYNISDKLILMNNGVSAAVATNVGVGLGSWSITPSSNITDDVTIAASPSWATSILPVPSGNALTYVGSGIDPELKFTDTTSGSLYSSFVFTAADTSNIVASTTTDPSYSTPIGFYSFLGESINSGTGSIAAEYASSIMFRKNMTSGKFNLGLSKSNSSTECVWSPTEYDFNTEHVVVISYENIGISNSLNQIANIWIDPTTNSQPMATLTQNSPVTSISRSHLDRIKLVQTSSSSTPLFVIDEIRVANNWGEAIGGTSTFAPLPSVESRQAFNSTTNPTVSDLVAIGTNLKWYTASTGGAELTTTSPLTYAKYYVSQTNNGIESPRVGTEVFVGDTALKTLPFYESFGDYNIADKLVLMNNNSNAVLTTNNGVGLGSWSISPSSNITDDVTIVASPVWDILPIASGNAISFAGSGIDPELKFTNTTSGNLYSSFVFSAADASTIVASTSTDPNYSTPTGFYGFVSENVDPVSGLVTAGYASDVMFRKNMVTGKFNLGLSKSNSGTECVWSPTEYSFNSQHVIVISYENIGDANTLNQVSNLWVDPASSSQAATLSQNNPVTPVGRDNLDRIKLLQASSSSTPLIVIDEIRVGTNFADTYLETTLGTNNVMNVSGFKMYPNPVTNGKLFIVSSTDVEKQVIIYNTLGQQVLQTTTITDAINVSNLSKGTYFVKINEAGTTATKKLIVQ